MKWTLSSSASFLMPITDFTKMTTFIAHQRHTSHNMWDLIIGGILGWGIGGGWCHHGWRGVVVGGIHCFWISWHKEEFEGHSNSITSKSQYTYFHSLTTTNHEVVKKALSEADWDADIASEMDGSATWMKRSFITSHPFIPSACSSPHPFPSTSLPNEKAFKRRKDFFLTLL
jgi:hypothetical protein